LQQHSLDDCRFQFPNCLRIFGEEFERRDNSNAEKKKETEKLNVLNGAKYSQSTKECADKQKYLFLSQVHTMHHLLFTERRLFRVYLIMKQHFFSVLIVLELASWQLDGFSWSTM